jgi:hypothetical protein
VSSRCQQRIFLLSDLGLLSDPHKLHGQQHGRFIGIFSFDPSWCLWGIDQSGAQIADGITKVGLDDQILL